MLEIFHDWLRSGYELVVSSKFWGFFCIRWCSRITGRTKVKFKTTLPYIGLNWRLRLSSACGLCCDSIQATVCYSQIIATTSWGTFTDQMNFTNLWWLLDSTGIHLLLYLVLLLLRVSAKWINKLWSSSLTGSSSWLILLHRYTSVLI